MDTVLFVCTHNSSRSQMAEGLLRDRYGDRYEVRSAGTNPGGVNPFAVAVMEEVGIDISDHTSDSVDAYADTTHDIVVTVCDDAAENCPYIPAQKETLHRGFDDPSAVTGSDEEKHAAFRRTRDKLADWIDATFGPTSAEEESIERARPDDLDAIRDLLRTVDLPHEDLTSAHLEHFRVARSGDALHGVVGVEPCGDVALLRSLAVAPDARGEGLGARLVDAAEEQAHEEGTDALYLLTTSASTYFQARGYEPMARDELPEAIQETEEAARLCPSSATCMRKTVSTAVDGPQTAE
jgi:arsenate reductase